MILNVYFYFLFIQGRVVLIRNSGFKDVFNRLYGRQKKKKKDYNNKVLYVSMSHEFFVGILVTVKPGFGGDVVERRKKN
jgi:hypothetical protein